ncbi:MAG: hypothetical protein KAR08_10725, partial [Candidatus Heimdallarchaeota archaeon]|nr:hypothetical protein [Candidatus Heimdallarchaeota archaeon]
MSSTVKKELAKVDQFIIQGNYLEASKLIEKISKTKDIANEDKLSAQILQSEILNKQGLYQDTLKLVNEIIEQSIGIDNPLIDLDTLIQKSEALMRINNLEQHKSAYVEGEKLILAITDLPPKIIAKRKASIYALKTWIPFLIGEFEKSLELSQKSLVFAEKSENQLLIVQQLYTVGWNFLFLEKFDLAEHHFRKGFALAEKIGNKQEIAYGHHSLASIAQKNRDFSEAKDLWSKAIEMNKELGTERDLPFIYNELGYLYRNRLEL